MLFKRTSWPGLEDGTVTLAFRRWKRPHARPGRLHRTPAGALFIDAVTVVEPGDITDDDARRAGFDGRAKLLRELDGHGDGPVYRVEFHHAGPDPRAVLRRTDRMSDEGWARVTERLGRLDRASRRGPWTMAVLRLIGGRPGVRAADLAASMGLQKRVFKNDVRKLKEMGLTESLEVGYRLSPRGRALLERVAAGASSMQDGSRTTTEPSSKGDDDG